MNPLFLAPALALSLDDSLDRAKPPMDVVLRIETALANKACIGPLDKWSRQYSFKVRAGKVNPNIVSVDFVEAGHDGRSQGLVVTEPFDFKFDIDDSQFKFVNGDYDLATGRFSRLKCGWNVWSLDKPTIDLSPQ